MKGYSQECYDGRHGQTLHAAETILSIVLEQPGPVRSAVDIGCGVGTWLSVLQARGVAEVLGVDGGWVDPKLLAIPEDRFRRADLGDAVEIPGRYDLAISLEVAEHIPPRHAARFVRLLTGLSDRVLFSAAVPYQGGRNHVNEQWPDYWIGLFDAEGYAVHDFIRPRIWDDERIPFWYRQNVLYFSRRPDPADARSRAAEPGASSMPRNVVHPELYLRYTPRAGVRGGFRLFVRCLKDCARKKLGRTAP